MAYLALHAFHHCYHASQTFATSLYHVYYFPTFCTNPCIICNRGGVFTMAQSTCSGHRQSNCHHDSLKLWFRQVNCKYTIWLWHTFEFEHTFSDKLTSTEPTLQNTL